MILSRRHSPELPALAKTALLALGLSVLPWAPRVFSQEQPPSVTPATEAPPLAPTAAPSATTVEAAPPAAAQAPPSTSATTPRTPAVEAAPPPAAPQAPSAFTPAAATPPVEPPSPPVGAAPPTATTPPVPDESPSNPLRALLSRRALPPATELPPPVTPPAQADGSAVEPSSEARLDRLERMLEQLIQAQQNRDPAIVENLGTPGTPPSSASAFRLPQTLHEVTRTLPDRSDLKKLDGEIRAIDEQIKSLEKQLGDLNARRAQVIKASAKRERLNYGDDVSSKTELFLLKLGDYSAIIGQNRETGAEVFEVDLETLGGIEQVRRDKSVVVLIGKNGTEVVLDLNAGTSLTLPKVSDPNRILH